MLFRYTVYGKLFAINVTHKSSKQVKIRINQWISTNTLLRNLMQQMKTTPDTSDKWGHALMTVI